MSATYVCRLDICQHDHGAITRRHALLRQGLELRSVGLGALHPKNPGMSSSVCKNTTLVSTTVGTMRLVCAKRCRVGTYRSRLELSEQAVSWRAAALGNSEGVDAIPGLEPQGATRCEGPTVGRVVCIAVQLHADQGLRHADLHASLADRGRASDEGRAQGGCAVEAERLAVEACGRSGNMMSSDSAHGRDKL